MALGKIKFLEATLVRFKNGKFFLAKLGRGTLADYERWLSFIYLFIFFQFQQINDMLPKSGVYISFKFKRRGLDMNV